VPVYESYFVLLYELNAINFCFRQRVLVIGGGGAVGLSAVQLAVAAGCSVSATCGAQSIEQVLAAGAEKAIDYTTEVKVLQKSEIFTLYLFTIVVW
jgi:NADPH:quinone reductase-like Zn-dependent oxidoreductase